MINPRTAHMLAHYNAWADRLIFDAVSALPPGEAAKVRPTLFKSMIGALNHNLVVDLIWQAHLEGRAHGFTARNLVLHADLGELWQAQRKVDAWFVDWSERQSEATLDEKLRFDFVSGEAGTMSRGQMLLHVVNHTSYHRGWVSDLFFQIPAKPPTTDLSVFLCDVSPDW
jgi:uncharacterized damage-inducible protein DinB